MKLRCKQERERLGLSLGDVAKELKIRKQHVSAVENGRVYPWPLFRHRLAKLYGLGDKTLFNDIDKAHRYLRHLGGE